MTKCNCKHCLENRGRQLLVEDLTRFAASLEPMNYSGIELDVEDAEELVALLEIAAETITELNYLA